MWVVNDIPSETRDSDFEVFSVLGMQFNVTVGTEKSQLGIVFRQDLHLEYL